MPRRRVLLVLISAATVLALALVLALDRGGPRPGVASSSGSHFAGAALPAGVPARDFTLQDQYGRRVSLESSSRGQVTMLAFVASSCRSACELIAQQIRGALDDLPRAAAVLLVSVDPAADTPARVSAFLARVSLAGRARYLTGTRPALAAVWRAYGVRPPSAGRGAFERSASVLLLDRDGRARVIFGLEQLTPEGLAHDVRALW